MEPADRLAAFLADELSADERQALEAELARDAHLRAQLEAIRRADTALGGLAPTALPDGARARLLAALEPTLDTQLGRPAHAAADELAVRRRTGSRRSRLAAVGGIAAAVAAVAVLGPTLGGLGGGDDAARPARDEDAATVESFAADDGRESAGDAAAGRFPPVGPTLLGSGRSIDEAAATELLATGEVEAVVAQGLSPDDASSLGAAWADAFGVDAARRSDLNDLGAATGEAAEGADEQEAPDTEATQGGGRSDDEAADGSSPAADLQILGDVDAAAREEVARCLETLLDAGGVVVPTLAELVTFAGEPAIAYALVGVAPDGTVSRPEVWVLSREDCETRYLRQG